MNEEGVAVWGGIECTVNRVGDDYLDQLAYAGHYEREGDIDLIGSLGIRTLRYPLLWERHQPRPDTEIDWAFTDRNLRRMQELGITPIAGLVHHGSGPAWVNFFDGSFETGVAAWGAQVARRYPWLAYYTPVNEPLTTARFCGLYGHWYPHGCDDYSFLKILLSECKATVLAMAEIRKINPDAKLIQTEDLGKCYSTPLLTYQRDMENERRWLSYDLLCGRLTPDKPMWPYLVNAGIGAEELQFFIDHPCVPHIAGFNYYLTSERYLDEDLSKYPGQYQGGNGRHRYADIETVLVPLQEPSGPAELLREAWERLQLPLAITECHLHSTREEQMRWFHTMWRTAGELRTQGVDIRAVTAWAMFGLFGWNCLVTKPCGDYEPGVFNVSTGCPRPTALARLLQTLTEHKVYYHPVLEAEGWWLRPTRRTYPEASFRLPLTRGKPPKCAPLLILGRTGTLGQAFARICAERHIHYLLLSRQDLELSDRGGMEQVVRELKPWAVVNAAGYVRVDDAETDAAACFAANSDGPALLAEVCAGQHIPFLTFSSDLVFDGHKDSPYTESDSTAPVSIYGRSKARAEELVRAAHPSALVVRTGAFFGPWDACNFVTCTLADLKAGKTVRAAADSYVSPTYVPDLVHACLDLLLDGEHGIVHLANDGAVSWAGLALLAADLAGLDSSQVQGVPAWQLGRKACRPQYSVLQSEKGIRLPSLENALQRYFALAGIGLLCPGLAA